MLRFVEYEIYMLQTSDRLSVPHIGRSAQLNLTIIIVSYNTRQKTVNCVRSIRDSTSATSYEIIVLDNASTDGSVAALRSAFPGLELIASPKISVLLRHVIWRKSTLVEGGYSS